MHKRAQTIRDIQPFLIDNVKYKHVTNNEKTTTPHKKIISCCFVRDTFFL